jgi:hypothetical protein
VSPGRQPERPLSLVLGAIARGKDADFRSFPRRKLTERRAAREEVVKEAEPTRPSYVLKPLRRLSFFKLALNCRRSAHILDIAFPLQLSTDPHRILRFHFTSRAVASALNAHFREEAKVLKQMTLAQLLKALIPVARSLPPGKIDLFFMLNALQEAANARAALKLSSEPITKEDFQSEVAAAIREGRAKNGIDFTMIVVVWNLHIVFVAVHLTNSFTPQYWSKRILVGLPMLAHLALVSMILVRKIKLLLEYSLRRDWPLEQQKAWSEALHWADQVIYRVFEFHRVDKRLTGLLPKALRNPSRAAKATITRWLQLCRDLEPILPDVSFVRKSIDALRFQEAPESPPDDVFVTLDQAAAMVQRSKRTLEKKRNLPAPDIRGSGGRPHEWKWNRIRPWLESEYKRSLPQTLPRLKPVKPERTDTHPRPSLPLQR